MQTVNYYRFWLLMVGAICVATIHEGLALILGVGLLVLGLVLPIFSVKIMAMGSKIENTVGEKVADKKAKEAKEDVAEAVEGVVEEVKSTEEKPAA